MWKDSSVFDVNGIERVSIKRSTVNRDSSDPATKDERTVDIDDYFNGNLDEGIYFLLSFSFLHCC